MNGSLGEKRVVISFVTVPVWVWCWHFSGAKNQSSLGRNIWILWGSSFFKQMMGIGKKSLSASVICQMFSVQNKPYASVAYSEPLADKKLEGPSSKELCEHQTVVSTQGEGRMWVTALLVASPPIQQKHGLPGRSWLRAPKHKGAFWWGSGERLPKNEKSFPNKPE